MSVMLAVTGALFAYRCYIIYKSGPSPFTRSSIAEAFSHVAVLTYVTVSLIVVGIAVHILLPAEEKRLKGTRSPAVVVKKLASRVDLGELNGELAAKILRERKLRRVLTWVRVALICLSATLPLIYLLNPANFPAESGRYNAEILHGMLLYLAFLAPVAVYEAVYLFVSDASWLRERELLLEAVKLVGVSDAPMEEPICPVAKMRAFLTENKKPITLGVRIAFVGCAIGFIIAGVLNGGMTDVLNKAIKICTECIGLG